jgi:hypothetical protein
MLCRDFGTVIDNMGNTGLGRLTIASLLRRELIDEFESRATRHWRCFRPFRITYVPRPLMSWTCCCRRSSESEYKDAASSSVLQMGMSGGSGHSTDSLFFDSKLDWEPLALLPTFLLPIT